MPSYLVLSNGVKAIPHPIDPRRLDELERIGRTALLNLCDEEVEGVIWVVLLALRDVDNARRLERAAARRQASERPGRASMQPDPSLPELARLIQLARKRRRGRGTA